MIGMVSQKYGDVLLRQCKNTMILAGCITRNQEA